MGEPYFPESGSFANWAAERYCLNSAVRGGVARTEVHHRPWPIPEAEVEIARSNLLAAAGITPLVSVPRCHFSTGVDVLSFPLEKIRNQSGDQRS